MRHFVSINMKCHSKSWDIYFSADFIEFRFAIFFNMTSRFYDTSICMTHISSKSLFAISDITRNTFFFIFEELRLIFRRRIWGREEWKRGWTGGEGKKKKHGCDDGLPDKGRGTDCYEILSNVRVSAQGASVRDLRAGKTRCSRIRVFVDRANDCRCIHIQNHVHRRRRPVPFELPSICGSVAGYTGCPGITVISLDYCPKNRTKKNTFNIDSFRIKYAQQRLVQL